MEGDNRAKLLQLLHNSYPQVPLSFIRSCVVQFDPDCCFQLVADRSAQMMLEMITTGGQSSTEPNGNSTPTRLRSVSFPTDPDCFTQQSALPSSPSTLPGGNPNFYALRSTSGSNLPYANIPRTIGGGSYVIRNSPAAYTQSPTVQSPVTPTQQQQPTVVVGSGGGKKTNLHLVVQRSNDSGEGEAQFSPSLIISNGQLGTPNIRVTPSSPSVTFVNAQRVSNTTSRSSSASRSPYDAPEVSPRVGPNSPWLHRRPDLLADFHSGQNTASSSLDSSPTSPVNRTPIGRQSGFNSGSSPALNTDESDRQQNFFRPGPIRLQTSSSCVFSHSDLPNGLTVVSTERRGRQPSPLSVIVSPGGNDRRMSFPDLITSPVRLVERIHPANTQSAQEVHNAAVRKLSQPLFIHVESDANNSNVTTPQRSISERQPFKGFSISLGMPNRTPSPLATTSLQPSGQQQPLSKPTHLSFRPGSVQGNQQPTAYSYQSATVAHDSAQPMAPSSEYIRSYVAKQLERKEKLVKELDYARDRQFELQTDVMLMESDLLSRRKHSLSQTKLCPDDITQLHADTRRLQAEVHTMLQELGADRAQKGNRSKTLSNQSKRHPTAAGSSAAGTSATQQSSRMSQFLKTLSCDGHNDLSDTLLKRLSETGVKRTGKSKFYANADPKPAESEPQTKLLAEESATGGSNRPGEHQWACDACTFHNDGAMPFCEVCQMPRQEGVEDNWLYVYDSRSPTALD